MWTWLLMLASTSRLKKLLWLLLTHSNNCNYTVHLKGPKRRQEKQPIIIYVRYLFFNLKHIQYQSKVWTHHFIQCFFFLYFYYLLHCRSVLKISILWKNARNYVINNKKFEYVLYIRFSKVATFCFAKSFEHFCHSLQVHAVATWMVCS